MVYLFIIFLASLAGLVQGVTGFGAGLVLMSVLPYFFGIVKGAAVSNFICLFMTGFMVKKYFKDIDWSKIYLAICLFVGGSLGAIYFVDKVNHNLLQLFFGLFLIIVALYFILFSGKIEFKASNLMIFICSLFSGICDGLFGIGGPLMSLLFMALFIDRKQYLGSLQAVFFCSGLLGFSFRIYRGIFSLDLLTFGLLGIGGVILGMSGSFYLNEKLDSTLIRRLTYILILVSGFISFITACKVLF